MMDQDSLLRTLIVNYRRAQEGVQFWEDEIREILGETCRGCSRIDTCHRGYTNVCFVKGECLNRNVSSDLP